MCVDVKSGMSTAAAVAWETAAEISLLVLAFSLLDRGCCSSVYCSSTGCCSKYVRAAAVAAAPAAAGVAAARTRRWWRTGNHWTELLAEQNCVSSEYWLCVSHRPKAPAPRNPDGKKNKRKTAINVKNSRQRMQMYLLVRDNTRAGPWAGPSNPRAGPRNCQASPYRARVSWALLP